MSIGLTKTASITMDIWDPVLGIALPGNKSELFRSAEDLSFFELSEFKKVSTTNDSFHISLNLDDIVELKDFVGKFKRTIDTINPVPVDQFAILSVAYAAFIIFGSVGNILILWAVLGRENMRTARNVFIVTLAISDLILCFFTMPYKLWEVLYRRWPFSLSTQWLCQLASAGQAAPIFMSSLAIVAIALDRYRCIIQHDLVQVSVSFSVVASLVMAFMSAFMAVPLFVGTQLRPYVSVNGTTFQDILVCSDDRKEGFVRTLYNLSAAFVQFVLPILIVFVVYLTIFARLRHRPQSQHSENNRKRRRTNIMIILVSVTFFLSWLPLNVLNAVMEIEPELVETHLAGQIRMIYGICNILGLSNACINPVLYGYLNENFRREFKAIYRKFPCIRSAPETTEEEEEAQLKSGRHSIIRARPVSSGCNNNAEVEELRELSLRRVRAKLLGTSKKQHHHHCRNETSARGDEKITDLDDKNDEKVKMLQLTVVIADDDKVEAQQEVAHTAL